MDAVLPGAAHRAAMALRTSGFERANLQALRDVAQEERAQGLRGRAVGAEVSGL